MAQAMGANSQLASAIVVISTGLTNGESSKQQKEKPSRLFRKTAKKKLISTRGS